MADQDERRRRGGQELPDEAQDRPEQNRGYDEAVRGDAPAREPDEAEPLRPDEPVSAESADEEAARRAAADVRRRERRSR